VDREAVTMMLRSLLATRRTRPQSGKELPNGHGHGH